MKTSTLAISTQAEKNWSAFLDILVRQLRERAKKVRSSELYWKEKDDGEYYCRRCAGKTRCGGSNNDECDGQAHCSKCGKILDCCFTDWGVEIELNYSNDEPLNSPVSPGEAFTLLNIIACGVPRLTERCGDFVYRIEDKPILRKIACRLKVPITRK